MRFVRTFWLKGNKLPFFVQFTAGAGSPLTVQLNVTLDPICALWFTGALIIVGFRPSIKGNKDVFYTIDLSRIHVNKGTNSRLGWTKYNDLYEIIHPSLVLISLFAHWSVMRERFISNGFYTVSNVMMNLNHY